MTLLRLLLFFFVLAGPICTHAWFKNLRFFVEGKCTDHNWNMNMNLPGHFAVPIFNQSLYINSTTQSTDVCEVTKTIGGYLNGLIHAKTIIMIFPDTVKRAFVNFTIETPASTCSSIPRKSPFDLVQIPVVPFYSRYDNFTCAWSGQLTYNWYFIFIYGNFDGAYLDSLFPFPSSTAFVPHAPSLPTSTYVLVDRVQDFTLTRSLSVTPFIDFRIVPWGKTRNSIWTLYQMSPSSSSILPLAQLIPLNTTSILLFPGTVTSFLIIGHEPSFPWLRNYTYTVHAAREHEITLIHVPEIPWTAPIFPFVQLAIPDSRMFFVDIGCRVSVSLIANASLPSSLLTYPFSISIPAGTDENYTLAVNLTLDNTTTTDPVFSQVVNTSAYSIPSHAPVTVVFARTCPLPIPGVYHFSLNASSGGTIARQRLDRAPWIANQIAYETPPSPVPPPILPPPPPPPVPSSPLPFPSPSPSLSPFPSPSISPSPFPPLPVPDPVPGTSPKNTCIPLSPPPLPKLPIPGLVPPVCPLAEYTFLPVYPCTDNSTLTGPDVAISIISISPLISPLLGSNVTIVLENTPPFPFLPNFTFRGIPSPSLPVLLVDPPPSPLFPVSCPPASQRYRTSWLVATPVSPHTTYAKVSLSPSLSLPSPGPAPEIYYSDDCPRPGQYGKGLECRDCPRGGECPGGNRIRAAPGFWNTGEDSGFVTECIPSSRCLGGKDPASMCAPGYTGQACGACADGYFQESTECVPCGDNVVTQTALLFALVGAFFGVVIMGVFFLSNANLTALAGVLSAVQLVSSCASPSPLQPEWMREYYRVLALFAFDVSFVRPGCSGLSGFVLSYALVGMFVAVAVVPLLIGIPLMTCIATSLSWKRYSAVFYTRRLVRGLSVMASLMYLVVTLWSLRALVCDPVSGVLVFDTNVVCWQGVHIWIAVASVTVLGVFSLGMPLGVLWVLVKRRRGLWDNEVFVDKAGFLFEDTQAPFFWFRLVEFALLFVDAMASAVVPASMPSVQAAVPGGVILVQIAVVAKWKPMHARIDNVYIMCISAASLVVLGVSVATRETFGLAPVQVFWLSLMSIVVSGVLLAGTIGVSVFLAIEASRTQKRLEKLAIQVGDFEKTCTLDPKTVPELIPKPFHA